MLSSEPSETPSHDLRRGAAEAIVRRFSYWSAGAGVIPIPGLDIAGIVGLQIKLIRDLALVYGIPFSEVRTRAIISALVGGILPVNAAAGVVSVLSSWTKMVPFYGPIVGGLSLASAAAAANYTIGRLFIEHFESGGTLLDVDVPEMRRMISRKKVVATVG